MLMCVICIGKWRWGRLLLLVLQRNIEEVKGSERFGYHYGDRKMKAVEEHTKQKTTTTTTKGFQRLLWLCTKDDLVSLMLMLISLFYLFFLIPSTILLYIAFALAVNVCKRGLCIWSVICNVLLTLCLDSSWTCVVLHFSVIYKNAFI